MKVDLFGEIVAGKAPQPALAPYKVRLYFVQEWTVEARSAAEAERLATTAQGVITGENLLNIEVQPSFGPLFETRDYGVGLSGRPVSEVRQD